MNARYTMTLEDVLKCYDLKALQTYPIFDESYRQELNNAIINYYSIYEIASETVEMFNNRLYSKLLNIMPYYNQLFELELSIKKMTIDKLFTNRYDSYETSNTSYTGTSNKTGDDTIQHGHTVNYTQGLRTDNTVYYNSSTDVKHGLTQTTDDDRENTVTNKQLGGKNIIESATLSADTPQNNSPISDRVGGGDFDTFNNSVFEINGYLSRADKTLNINERHDENEVKSYVDGDLTVTNSGTDTTYRYGDDSTNIYQSGGTTTQNTGNDTTVYNNLTTDNNTSDNTKHLNGNSDYIKSINDLRNSFININMLIIKDLKECFLGVF